MAFNVGSRPIRIAVGVGHANLSGGNQYELGINRKVIAEFLKLVRASTGFDVRCYTPNDGQGTYPGTLDAAVYGTVHKWVAAGWLPDVVFEIHQEGLGNTSVRGGFVIYPDSRGLSGRKASGGDFIDNDVLAAGPQMARLITQAVGTILRGNGTMSERATGVGGSGYRLGYFGALSDSYFQNNACVFISEGATYTNAADKALMDRADFAPKQARGLLEAVVHLAATRGKWTFPYKIGGGSTPAPQPTPPPATPFAVGTRLKATDRLNVRGGYSRQYSVRHVLAPGDEVEVIADSSGRSTADNDGYVWVNVAGSWGTGWAASNWLEIVAAPDPGPSPQPDTFTTRYELPLRNSPGFNGPIEATLPVGTKGVITAGPEMHDGIGWYKAKLADGREGWVPASILRTLDIEGGDA